MTTRARAKIHAQAKAPAEPPIPPDKYRTENARAWQQIGTTSAEVADWFIRFARLDLGTIRDGQWTDLRYEVGALAEWRVLAPAEPSLFWGRAFASKDWRGRTRKTNPLTLEPPTELPPPHVIAALQAEVVEHLTTLADGAACTALAIPSAIVALAPVRDRDSVLTVCTVEHPGDLFRYTFLTSLCWWANRVRRCKDCQQIFRADRRNKEYCSTACQNRAGTRRWRESGGRPRRKKKGRKP